MRYKLILPVSILFVFVLSILCMQVPFFWDSAYFSKQANCFYVQGFFPLIPPNDLDNGGFPLYGIFMALSWKIAGRTLLVSHLALALFLSGIAIGYYRLACKFLKKGVLAFAMILLLLEPCFITQAVLMANDILLLCFFLGGINALLEKKMVQLSLFLLLMTLCGIRGMISACSFVPIHLFLEFRKGRAQLSSILCYVPMTLSFVAWAMCHHIHSGWYFFSPLRVDTDEHFLGLQGMGKQLLLTIWKLVDSGRIFCWLFVAWGIWFLIRNRLWTPELKTLLVLLLFPLLSFLVLMVPVSNPSSSRYFMPTYLVLCLCVCFVLQHLPWKTALVCFLFIGSGLISGNFWLYPERFSNGWDTSLKVLPFFELKQEMVSFVKTNKLVPQEIGTRFPMIDDSRDNDLEGDSFQFSNFISGPVTKFRYYLHSNVCNTALLPQIETVRLKWKLLKELKKGEVYICLYENPDWVFIPTR